jgi:SNF2 family DNA or RNA helicase
MNKHTDLKDRDKNLKDKSKDKALKDQNLKLIQNYTRLVDSYSIDLSMENFDKFITHCKLDKKQYQYDGLRWCLQNELALNPLFDIRGGFIADEMGLGKTITMIGLCLSHFVRRTLIVLPVVIIEQWVQQFIKTTGHKPYVFTSKFDLNKLISAPIVICSYHSIMVQRPNKNKKNKNKNNNNNIILNDESADNINGKNIKLDNILHRIKWDRVIFDEAHHLRNKKTLRSIGAKILMSPIKWLVSGTPIQNSKNDFYTLSNILGIPASVYANKNFHKNIIHLFVLKRTKMTAGIQLPDVVLHPIVVPWKNIHEKNISQEIHAILPFTNVPMDKIGTFGHFIGSKGLLVAILKAKQSCILPKMLSNNIHLLSNSKELLSTAEDNQLDVSADSTNIFKYIHNLHSGILSNSKMDAIVDVLISRIHNGNGKVVFCHFRSEIDEIFNRLSHFVSNHYSNMNLLASSFVHKFDGRISNNVRKNIIQSTCFDSNDSKLSHSFAPIIIMQIQTGCEGLNLQNGFSEIYFTTPHWNPSIEDQAIARCHRIGQLKSVQVFKFQMSGFQSDNNKNNNDNNDNNNNNNNNNSYDSDSDDQIILEPLSLDNYVSSIQGNKRNISTQLFGV